MHGRNQAHRRRPTLTGAVVIEPMEARLVDGLPDEPGWQFEPKWDGFRCLAYRSGNLVDLRAKSGKPLGRYFPKWSRRPARCPATTSSSTASW